MLGNVSCPTELSSVDFFHFFKNYFRNIMKTVNRQEKVMNEAHHVLYSYFMPVCSIVKTITPRCHGRPDALSHEAEGRVQ